VALAVVAVAVAAVCAGCGPEPHPWALRVMVRDYTFAARDHKGRVVPEGRTVSAEQLERGREAYLSHCACCHGLNGDGRGRCAVDLDPPPRDLRSGNIKFGAVRSGALVNDDDLLRILRHGLSGTAMRGWHLRDSDLHAVIQFIKTFPALPCAEPRSGSEPSENEACRQQLSDYPDSGKPNAWQQTYTWGDKKGLPRPTGAVVRVGADPWKGREPAAIIEGEALYHLKAECMSCHPAHLDEEQLVALARRRARASRRTSDRSPPDIRTALGEPVALPAKDNPYGLEIVPPNLARDPLRSVRGDSELSDLARLIASGVGGIMPAWDESLTAHEIWALSYYVQSLRDD